MDERLFTAEEVADRLRLNKVTVHRWIRSGKLPAANLGGTSGYRIRGSDMEALLWVEYGGMKGYLRRAARAVSEAAEAAREYADRFGNEAMAVRSTELREQGLRMVQEAEHFADVQGFYRPPAAPQTLVELQPFMAAAQVYDAANDDFKVLAVMVTDATSGSGRQPSAQGVVDYIRRAEASNPPDSDHGWLIRVAGPLLLAHCRRLDPAGTSLLGARNSTRG